MINKTYILFLIMLVIILTALVGLLVYRAHANDIFFSEQEPLEVVKI